MTPDLERTALAKVEAARRLVEYAVASTNLDDRHARLLDAETLLNAAGDDLRLAAMAVPS